MWSICQPSAPVKVQPSHACSHHRGCSSNAVVRWCPQCRLHSTSRPLPLSPQRPLPEPRALSSPATPRPHLHTDLQRDAPRQRAERKPRSLGVVARAQRPPARPVADLHQVALRRGPLLRRLPRDLSGARGTGREGAGLQASLREGFSGCIWLVSWRVCGACVMHTCVNVCESKVGQIVA